MKIKSNRYLIWIPSAFDFGELAFPYTIIAFFFYNDYLYVRNKTWKSFLNTFLNMCCSFYSWFSNTFFAFLRSSRLQMFLKINVFKNFTIFKFLRTAFFIEHSQWLLAVLVIICFYKNMPSIIAPARLY